MEGFIMTLARLSNSMFPSIPSLMDRFFENDLMDWNASNYTSTNSTMPAVNVKENDDEFQIEVAAPGMKKGDFKINYDNGRLTISSERTDENKEQDGEKVTRKEFSYQSFQRSFSVPEEMVNSDKIKANYADGILYVNLPKREEVKPKPAREISIS
jgi:HSP20 family protein